MRSPVRLVAEPGFFIGMFTGMNKVQSGRLPASLFYGCNDGIQKCQFLFCMAGKGFDPPDHCGCVSIRDPLGKYLLLFCRFGIVHDQSDRCYVPDSGHLHGHCPAKFPETDSLDYMRVIF